MKDKIMSADRIEAYYDQFPSWYWKYGLHDAQIFSIKKQDLHADWKSERPIYNALEFYIDSKDAIYEKDITKIVFYNYHIDSDFELPHGDVNLWWVGDKITELKNKQYKIELELWNTENGYHTFYITFDKTVVERK